MNSLKKISFFVIVFHFFFIAWAVRRTSNLDLLKKPQKRIVTQTVALNEKKTVAKETNPKPVEHPKPKEVKPKPKPKEEKPKPKPKEVKKEKPKPKEVKKEKPVPKKREVNQEMIAKAQENIAKINKTRDKITQKESVKIPKVIKDREVETTHTFKLTDQEVGYRDELANRLKLLLRLPEFGKVNMKLTLNRRGEVQKMVILNAESEINKKYVEENVPELTFPSFGNNFGGTADYTFLISLNNED